VVSQPNLFSPFADTPTTQRELRFDAVAIGACTLCGAELVETPSGYWACPHGHGKLLTPDGYVPADVADEQDVQALHAKQTQWLGDPPCECGLCRAGRAEDLCS
jgi:hypothetical protein